MFLNEDTYQPVTRAGLQGGRGRRFCVMDVNPLDRNWRAKARAAGHYLVDGSAAASPRSRYDRREESEMKAGFGAALAALALLPAAVSAQTLPLSPGWVADPRSGCKAWSMRTGEGASFSWTGDCDNGFASGNGTLVWINGSRYDGDMKGGRYDGRGTFVGVNGIRYDGEWKDYRPNGMGTLTRADGVSFTGVWRNGCFRQGPRWSVFMTTTKECGFE